VKHLAQFWIGRPPKSGSLFGRRQHPNLNPGVFVHIHDIFYPFEYPKESFVAGRAWNELYMLRSFLQFNFAYRIVFMNTFMEHFHEDFFRQHMPLCLVNRGGSIWLQRNA